MRRAVHSPFVTCLARRPQESYRAYREVSLRNPSPQLGDFAVFLKELAQIRKEEKEKKRRRLENINSLKGMGYSTHAAKQALHQASGNLDEALKVAHPPGPLGLP